MLPKDKRLNLKTDFIWIRSGIKIANNLVRVFYRFGENPFPKVGIATSKSNFPESVDRNRARRLISKAFENIYHELPEKINVLVMPNKEVLKASSEELTVILEDLLKKGNIIKN